MRYILLAVGVSLGFLRIVFVWKSMGWAVWFSDLGIQMLKAYAKVTYANRREENS